jgi:endo-1,4-beta-xylanase
VGRSLAAIATLALLVVSGLVGSARPAQGATCDPSVPETCTLQELADLRGLRIGSTLEPDEVVDAAYMETLVREFNSVTPENALKWYTVQPSPGAWNFGPGDAVVDAAVANGLEVRGHTLVWAQDAFTPDWVEAVTDPVALQALVNEQITRVMERYGERVHRWDVVNEPLATLAAGPSESVFWRVLGPDWVADAFRTAHAVDPTAELWLNEVGTDYLPDKHDALLALVAELVADGVPIHGVGIQGHRFTPDGPDQATLERQLRDFTDLGLAVAITELDVATDPADPSAAQRQADAYARMVGACLAVAGCDEVTMWGLTDRSTWLDSFDFLPKPSRPLLFDEQLRPKPAYERVRALLAAAVAAPGPPVAPPPAPSSPPATSRVPARPAEPVTATPTLTG